MSTTVTRNPRNGHKATTSSNTWDCNCGQNGTQADEQRAQIAAQIHVRHPERAIPELD